MEQTSEGLIHYMDKQHTFFCPLAHIFVYQPLQQVQKWSISGIGANFGEGVCEDDLVY